ncbi:hypothetical protein H6G04_15395 [Calothrix membranacea FACHB-236]|nr:hypothetical protein [Calothrix membranacea FACHB-236]
MFNISNTVKETLKQIPAIKAISEGRYLLKREEMFESWRVQHSPSPPPHFIKQQAILDYVTEKFNLVIETGTFYGSTTEFLSRYVEQVYSIELSKELYEIAKTKFANNSSIHLFQGDSADVLQHILDSINEPIIFWLDGHYSGDGTAKGFKDTPIVAELEAIFKHPLKKEHIILIDDARCFVGSGDYPSIDTLKKFSFDNGFECFYILNDIIRIHN